MLELGIIALVVGPILLALVFIPGLVPVLLRVWETLGRFSPRRGPTHNIPLYLPLSGDVWLLASGGVMLFLGLFVLYCSASSSRHSLEKSSHTGNEKQDSMGGGVSRARQTCPTLALLHCK